MRTGRPIAPLSLGVEERATLEGWARRAKSAQALAQRARIVLECGSGSPNTAGGGWLRHCKRQRCLALGWPGADRPFRCSGGLGGAKASPRICAAALSTPDRQQPFFCSKSDARSIYRLSPPPRVRTERNLQNSSSLAVERATPGARYPMAHASLGRLRAKFSGRGRFRSSLQKMAKIEDCLAEQDGFEPPVPLASHFCEYDDPSAQRVF
jgi:hypothetical protein